jgi:alkyl hydroperoxide reductase subunit AhpC
VAEPLVRETQKLYGLPLSEFTAARNARAKALKQKEPELAAAVAALPKPSVASGALNELVREDPSEIRALVQSGKRLRTAQEAAVAGRKGADLNEAIAEHRAALERVQRELRRRKLSGPTLDRATQTLRVASLDPELWPLLERGLLHDDLASSGFGIDPGLVPKRKSSSKGKAPAEAKPKPDRKERRARRSATPRRCWPRLDNGRAPHSETSSGQRPPSRRHAAGSRRRRLGGGRADPGCCSMGIMALGTTTHGGHMALQLNDTAPDFEADSTEGRIRFHDWIGDSWAVIFSHPKDFTPVCTTELGYMAKIKPEFDKRSVKVIGLSVDPTDRHEEWAKDIEETQGHAPNYPIIADADFNVSKLYGMLASETEGDPLVRTPADNQTVRNVFVIGPDKKIKLILVYPMTTGRNFDEVLRVIDSLQLTSTHKVSTPVNWKQGEDVIIAGSVSDDEARETYPDGWESPKPYIRIVPQPR